ncbi:carbohydrate ABC transporter permease [Jiangella muralis]|uniref:carbohydrate ABC transporter permease n=1 Tax=Jiangella muralis TaxID=702383 RepID=UPI00069D4CEB|nr:carbohydrate ABC transporter permease [Jiangella muralis]
MRTASHRRHPALLVAVIVITGATLYPFAWVVFGAFKSQQEIFGSPLLLPQEWRWDNFATAWTTGNFGHYFANSMMVALAVTVLEVAVACPAGYAFAKTRLRNHAWVFYVYLFGLTLPVQAIIIPLFYQLQSYGLVNSRTGLSLVIVATAVPFAVFLMRSFFRDLPDAMVEAARIDGANEWKIFWRVMLPMATPGLLALAVFSFLGAWNEFLLALLLLTDDASRTLPLGLVRFQSEMTANYGALFAGIVLAMIPSVLVYVALQRSFIRGLSAGSVK